MPLVLDRNSLLLGSGAAELPVRVRFRFAVEEGPAGADIEGYAREEVSEDEGRCTDVV